MSLFNPIHFGAFDRVQWNPVFTNIVAFDSEDDSKGKPTLFAFYDNGKVLKKKSFVTKSAEEAVRFIYEYPIPSIFVSHNLEYDIANLFGYCNFLYCDEFTKSPLLMKVTLHKSNHVFLNSLSYFKGSLKSMGKVIGLEKMEGKEVSALNPKYIVRDAEIVWHYMSRFQSRLCGEMQVPLRLSIGSIAMATFRQSFMSSDSVTTYNNPLLLEGYYGGRVEVFYRGQSGKGINVCDINSSYPNVMRNFEYPDTGMLEPSSIHTHKFGVGHFKIKVPENDFLPVLPIKSGSGRLFFPVGEIEGYWCYAEVREALKRGAKIIEEFDGVGTNMGVFPFNEFVDFFYSQRLLCKNILSPLQKKIDAGFDLTAKEWDSYNKAKFESEFLKLVLNNLYGKFCQHKPKSRLSRRPLPENLLVEALGENYKEKKVGPLFEYTEKEGTPPKTANYMWGIYVTCYARLELLKHLSTVHEMGGTLLYCDTDSVMFEYKGDISKKLDIGNSLGQLSLEKCDYGIFRQSKGYLLCNEVNGQLEVIKSASKGVAIHEAPAFILDGVALAKKPMRFKEALIRTHAKSNKGKALKDIGLNVWREIEKKMRSIDCKRTQNFGVTYPINAKDIETIEENASSEPVSWRDKITAPVKGKEFIDNFAETKIPPNWFRKKGLPRELKNFESEAKEKIFRVRLLDIEACPPGSIFLAGDCLEIVTEKRTFGKGDDRKVNEQEFIALNLCAYLGETIPHKMIKAYFPLKALKILDHNRGQLFGRRLTLTRDEGKTLQVKLSMGRKKLPLSPVPREISSNSQEKMRERLKEFLIKRFEKISLAKQKKFF